MESRPQERDPEFFSDCEFKLDKAIVFSSISVFVSADATSQRVVVNVQDQTNLNAWSAQFNPQVIEQIASRTGSPKTYTQFLGLLVKAMKNEDANVFLDLLGKNDLAVIIG